MTLQTLPRDIFYRIIFSYKDIGDALRIIDICHRGWEIDADPVLEKEIRFHFAMAKQLTPMQFLRKDSKSHDKQLIRSVKRNDVVTFKRLFTSQFLSNCILETASLEIVQYIIDCGYAIQIPLILAFKHDNIGIFQACYSDSFPEPIILDLISNNCIRIIHHILTNHIINWSVDLFSCAEECYTPTMLTLLTNFINPPISLYHYLKKVCRSPLSKRLLLEKFDLSPKLKQKIFHVTISNSISQPNTRWFILQELKDEVEYDELISTLMCAITFGDRTVGLIL